MKTHNVLARMALSALRNGNKRRANGLWEEAKVALRKREGWA